MNNLRGSIMKYIRTKDGIYEYVDYDNECIIPSPIIKYKNKLTHCSECNIIKQADTIEELCDEFVFEETYPSGLKRHIITEDVCVGTQFGAIWTDKGLIYVAKMNEEGVLCLI